MREATKLGTIGAGTANTMDGKFIEACEIKLMASPGEPQK